MTIYVIQFQQGFQHVTLNGTVAGNSLIAVISAVGGTTSISDTQGGIWVPIGPTNLADAGVQQMYLRHPISGGNVTVNLPAGNWYLKVIELAGYNSVEGAITWINAIDNNPSGAGWSMALNGLVTDRTSFIMAAMDYVYSGTPTTMTSVVPVGWDGINSFFYGVKPADTYGHTFFGSGGNPLCLEGMILAIPLIAPEPDFLYVTGRTCPLPNIRHGGPMIPVQYEDTNRVLPLPFQFMEYPFKVKWDLQIITKKRILSPTPIEDLQTTFPCTPDGEFELSPSPEGLVSISSPPEAEVELSSMPEGMVVCTLKA